MLKIVVFDGGYGGELFADYLEEVLPTVEVIRVIDWRNAEALTTNARTAREVAEKALEPYLGKVDLIVFANHLLSITSLRYFRRKYKAQRFLGLFLEMPRTAPKRDFLILTTKAVRKTLKYRFFVWRLKARSKTLTLDAWPAKIDDGELGVEEICQTLETAAIQRNQPHDIILACAQFRDIKTELGAYFNQRVRIYDSFEEAMRGVCRLLKIRGGMDKRRY